MPSSQSTSGFTSGNSNQMLMAFSGGSSNHVDADDSNSITYPDVPTNMRVTHKDDNSITFEWDIVDYAEGIASYDVYESGFNAGIALTNTFTHTGLLPDTTYEYIVVAVGNDGFDSDLSDTLTVKTMP